MNTFIEIEAKYLIGEESYRKLIKFLKFKKRHLITQTNEYFDSDDSFISSNKWMLRVRTSPKKRELTLKVPLENGLSETNYNISDLEYENIKTTGKVFMPRLEDRKFTVIGVLTTYRYTKPYLDGEIFIDESHYGDKVDYEVEYEVKDNLEHAQEVLKKLFSQLDIKDYRVSISKFKRCMEEKISHKGD